MTAPGVRSTRLWYLIPALLMGIGLVVLAAGVLKFIDAFQESNAYLTDNGITIPGQASFVLTEPGTYSVFCETDRDRGAEEIAGPGERGLTVVITGRTTGEAVPLTRTTAGSVSYTNEKSRGFELWTCRITEPGVYDAKAFFPDGSRDDAYKVQIVKDFRSNLIRMLGGLMGGVLAFLIAYFLAAGSIVCIYLIQRKAKQRMPGEGGAS